MRALLEAGVGPPAPPKAISDIELTPSEQRRFRAIAEARLSELADALTSRGALDDLPSDARTRLLAHLRARAQEAATAQLGAELEVEWFLGRRRRTAGAG